MSTQTLLILAQVSFDLGLIDVVEYDERIQVARWISDEPALSIAGDPREPLSPEAEQTLGADTQTAISGSGKVEQPDWIELLVLGKWLFTKSDPDAYPSTPHGHLHSATRVWPKLNAYTGRVFKAKHQEEVALRLGRREMQRLWRDHAFRDFCRSYILLYVEAHPHYAFSVRKPLRFPRW